MKSLEQLSSDNALVTVETIGQTFENRSLVMVSIGRTDADATKPVIFFDCAVHAREWIAPATCLWFVDQLANQYGNDSQITRLVDSFEWKIVPVSNPDGYAYSWTTVILKQNYNNINMYLFKKKTI